MFRRIECFVAMPCIRFVTAVVFPSKNTREKFFRSNRSGTNSSRHYQNFEHRFELLEIAKMKKILVSTTAAAALLVTSLVAQAADLPQRAYAPAPVMIAAVYDWTGFYIGANGGYGTSRNCWGVVPVGGGVVIPDGCHSQSGGIIGGQAGYRWQMGSAVFGLEAQGDWASLRSSHVSIVNPLLTDSSKVTGLGLFTGQIGYAWNAALLYLKGGAALTSNSLLQSTTIGGIGLNYATSTRWGGAIGVGFEYGFTPNWSAGIEYDHLFMGNANNSFSVPAGAAAVVNRISQDVDMFTVRVNYKFGGPVVARY
jgi:outer membrane immunogenic protein